MHRPPPDVPKERYFAREQPTRPKQPEPPHLNVERQAEKARAELQFALERVLHRDISVLHECFRTLNIPRTSDPKKLESMFNSFEPRIRHTLRQQVIGEVWAAAAFDRGSLSHTSGGRVDSWEKLDASERQMIVQKAERLRATIENRKPVSVVAFWGSKDNTLSSTDSDNMAIELNYDKLLKSATLQLAVRVTAHEGQHVCDLLAMERPELAPHYSKMLITALRHNADNYIEPGPTQQSMLRYQRQPIERLAFEAEDRIWTAFSDFQGTEHE